MRIAARLAIQSPCTIGGSFTGATIPPGSPVGSYHGSNIVINALSEHGFEAECGDAFPMGALVRLRLPGAGMAVARVTDARPGRLSAAFVNPVGQKRLAMTMGIARPALGSVAVPA